jgi:hypothetical protein
MSRTLLPRVAGRAGRVAGRAGRVAGRERTDAGPGRRQWCTAASRAA